jgi:hypothetical protein
VGNVRTQEDVLTDISEKLDSILGFLAIRGIEGDPGKVVVRLRDLGLNARCISRVAGITENAVAIRLSRLKKPKTSKGGKKSKATPVNSPEPVVTMNEQDPS